MKKIALVGLSLISASLIACGDSDSAKPSTSNEASVSCKVSVDIDGDEVPYICVQVPESQKGPMKRECDEIAEEFGYKVLVSDTPCDAHNVKKECKDAEGTFFIYDKTLSRMSCEEFLSDEESEDDEDDGEDEFDVIDGPISFYNVSEQKCVEFNAGADPKSDIVSLLGIASEEEIADENIVMGDGCNTVKKDPVVSCSDNDTHDAVTVYFYDESMKGKKCEDIVKFIPNTEEEVIE